MTQSQPAEPARRFSLFRAWPLLLLVFALLILVMIFLSQRRAQAAPPQPLPFSHRLHDQAGIPCLYCHPNAMRSDIAGLPSVEFCMGCHRTIASDQPAIQELAGYWERQEPIPWQLVNPRLDFVFFSHMPHLGNGVNCETCHGNIGVMDGAGKLPRSDMGWCLECHIQQPPERAIRLADCLACHK